MKWGEWWWSDEQENRLILVFESGRYLEDRMIYEVFLLMILWEYKSKVLLDPKIFFELSDEIEDRWLDPVFKVGEDLVGGINAGSMSSLG